MRSLILRACCGTVLLRSNCASSQLVVCTTQFSSERFFWCRVCCDLGNSPDCNSPRPHTTVGVCARGRLSNTAAEHQVGAGPLVTPLHTGVDLVRGRVT